MTTLVSLALNNANRLPIVGSPIGQATTWYRTRSNSNSSSSENLCETPPPPYEKEPVHSRLGLISDYVLKRAASFSSSSAPLPQQKETLSVTAVEQQALDKKQVDEGITLIQMATKMNSEVSPTSGAGAGAGNSYQMSMDLYLMGLDKILNSIPGNNAYSVVMAPWLYIVILIVILIVDADPTIKSNLESKLLEFKQKNGLVLQEEHTGKKKLTEEEQNEALRGLSNLIIHAAVLSAVALKKSPIPGNTLTNFKCFIFSH